MVPSNRAQFYDIRNHAIEYICFWPQNLVPIKLRVHLFALLFMMCRSQHLHLP